MYKNYAKRYYLRLPPALEREEPPDERMLPDDMVPDERYELPDDERTDDELDEREELPDDERTDDELDEREGEVAAERVTVVDVREGEVAAVRVVVVDVLRDGEVAAERVTVVDVLRDGEVAAERVTVVEVREGEVAAVRVVDVRVGVVAAVRVVDVRRLLLPYVRSVLLAWLTRVAVVRDEAFSPRTAAVRVVARRCADSACALLMLRDALRVRNDLSGCRCA